MGRPKVYDVKFEMSVTNAQEDFLQDTAALYGVSKREFIRILIDRAFAEALLIEMREGSMPSG